jgi:phage terminase small subunit
MRNALDWQSIRVAGARRDKRTSRKNEQMPILTNSRHEAFAHGLAAGKSIEAAFREAGYSPNSGNASRLNGNERVIARVAELKALIQNMRKLSTHRAVLTTEWVTEQLIGVVIDAKARDKPDLAGANKALHLLGLQLGMFVERKETGKPGEYDELTIAGKRDRILSIASQLGLCHVSEVGPRRFGNYLTVPAPRDVERE